MQSSTSFCLEEEMMDRAPRTLVELLRARAQEHPTRIAYTFVAPDGTEELSLSYEDLDRKARKIGAAIQALNLGNANVLLLYPFGLEYIAAFFGCLYAGAVAVPAYPPRSNRNLTRFQSIIADAEAQLVLTTQQLRGKLEPFFANQLQCLVTEDILDPIAEAWQPGPTEGNSLCFLQYTSGSTSTPRGVMVSHSNLLHNEALIAGAFAQGPESVIVSWLPLYHDMGLIGGVLQPLYLGARCVLFSPLSFLQRPALWLELITRYRATTSGGPNFAYDLCARKISAEERRTFDLSSWQVAFNGAEPVRHETLERFTKTFGPAGFRRDAFFPCYGLAEATLLVSGGKPRRGPATVKTLQGRELEKNRVIAGAAGGEGLRYVVGCGNTAPGQKVVVVNPETLAECGSIDVGEIWVSGPSVAQGYWKQPELTAQTFGAYLAKTGEGPFLRTGDLGFVDDGELFVTGRLKDLIIIRGLNYYPHDIELIAEKSHPALRPGCGAAFMIANVEELVIVYEVDRRGAIEMNEVLDAVREAVAEELELQVSAILLTLPGSIPKTSSGKIQRARCREMFLAGEFTAVAEWRAGAEIGVSAVPLRPYDTESIEVWLAQQLAAKLGVDPSRIDVEQPVVRYGIDSLLAVELAHLMQNSFGVSVPMVQFLQNSSIRDLARSVVLQPEDAGPVTSAQPWEQPLSSGQQSLWFMQKLAPESTTYNLARAFRVKSKLDPVALRRGLEKLVARHASLRATFAEVHGKPVQRIRDFVAISFNEHESASWIDDLLQKRLAQEVHQPFDLEEGPLLRMSLFRRAHDEYVLLLVIHHIVSDFWSFAIIMKELTALYAAELNDTAANLDLLSGQYSDYAQWQTEFISSDKARRAEEYWQQQLAGELPLLNLPTDNPRPAFKTFAGGSTSFAFDREFSAHVKELSREHGVTPYMILLAGFYVLLQRLTGQHDFVVGTLTSGRNRSEFAGTIGYFVNPLPLRADLSGEPTFAEVVERVRALVLSAFEHQDYPFPQLVNLVQPQRDPARSPIFDAAFVLQKTQLLEDKDLSAFALELPGAELEFNGLLLETLPLESRTAHFDLMLMMAETSEGLAGRLEYNSDLYGAEEMERVGKQYERLLREAVARPWQRMSRLSVLDEAEQQQLLAWGQQGGAARYQGRTVPELFAAQAARTPEAIAVRGAGDETLTYAELAAEARRIGSYLRRLGIGAEQLVGVCLRRRPQLLAALLGLMEAGAAYVPLDPRYPAERLRWMLADAGAQWVLSEEQLVETVAAIGSESAIVTLEEALSAAVADDDESGPRVAPGNLAYVLYTSGSTGRPKGVMLTHESVAALLGWAHEQYEAATLAGVLASTSSCFDLSIFEMFAPLTCGGTVVLVEDVLELGELVERETVRLVNTVPSAMVELLRLGAVPESVRVVNLAGEALEGGLVAQVYEQLPQVEAVWNLYGPTEDTTYSTGGKVLRGTRKPNIGRVLPGGRLYIVDSEQQLVPVGVVGELLLGGVGLGRGYWGRPELTAERFVPDGLSGEAGARLYRTGDVGRYQRAGTVEYLGRMDQQVKVRGFRIELGEIETALLGHEWVREAAVVAQAVAGGQRLVAYVVLQEGRPDAGARAELQQYLAGLLPEYMLPAAIELLAAMPRTPNGKLARRELPAVTEWGEQSAAAVTRALTPVEQLVAGIWSEVLGRPVQEAGANFFALGGHSLLATQVVSRLRAAFGVELPLRLLFESPTLAAQARTLQQITDKLETTQTVKPAKRDLYRTKWSGPAQQLTVPDSVKRFL